MILWTIHTEHFYVKSKGRGYIKADARYVARDMKNKYIWMAEKMLEMGLTKKRTFPVWAWYAYNGKRKGPDLRRSGHLPRGTKGVCIAFDAYDSDVLLSNFDQWHAAVNTWYLPKSEKEEAYFEKYPHLLTETIVRRSWDKMFDLEYGSEDLWGPTNERCIQACVSIVHNNQIREVVHFVAK